MSAGTLYMVPCPIVEGHLDTIPPDTTQQLHRLRHFVVERLRTARRYISSTKPPYAIGDLEFIEMDKHASVADSRPILEWLAAGHDVGILSESGCPGIADPGAQYVAAAHHKGYRVVPLVGPSSILLSLIASGMNGQSFAFAGYLPIQGKELTHQLRELSRAAQGGQTQIWIETPYRNDKHVKVLLDHLHPDLRLCIATEVTASDGVIRAKTIHDWKKKPPSIGKRNTIYLLGQ